MATRVTSREYKIMLKRSLFADRDAATANLRRDLRTIGRKCGVVVDGEFEDVSQRRITFFDTRKRELAALGLVFRRRERKKKIEYTLKCRSPDRYIAAGADVRSRRSYATDSKFEEDIAAPFQSRYSHSNTIVVPRDEDDGPPRNIKAASRLFPAIREANDKSTWPGSMLNPVGNCAFESVWTGVSLELEGQLASVALIVWSATERGRPLLAEFSFRYKAPRERFSAPMAIVAKDYYAALQQSSWFDSDARTKTQFVFDA